MPHYTMLRKLISSRKCLHIGMIHKIFTYIRSYGASDKILYLLRRNWVEFTTFNKQKFKDRDYLKNSNRVEFTLAQFLPT